MAMTVLKKVQKEIRTHVYPAKHFLQHTCSQRVLFNEAVTYWQGWLHTSPKLTGVLSALTF
jgi:hypothetical protein